MSNTRQRQTTKLTQQNNNISYKNSNDVDNTKLSSTKIQALVNKKHIFYISLIILFITRSIISLYHPIQDCDEIYNYYEPTHLLLYGRGQQTWEYSSVYALRSYTYILLHCVTAYIVKLLTHNSIYVFYSIRILLSLISSYCDSALVYTVYNIQSNNNKQQLYNKYVSIILCILLTFSSGLHHSSISYLPSSFVSYCVTLAISYWIKNQYEYVIIYLGISVLFVWPFSAIICILPAINILYNLNSIKQLYTYIYYGIITSLCCIVSSLILDYIMYQRIVYPIYNIATYNALTEHGADLYGTEPATFYIFNLLLNFNICFILSLVALPIALIYCYINKQHNNNIHISTIKISSTMLLWLTLMSSMSHKEERFMYVVYTCICYCSAYTLVYSIDIVNSILDKLFNNKSIIKLISRLLLLSTILLSITLSISRTLAVINGYNAPLHVYTYLYNTQQQAHIDNKQLSLQQRNNDYRLSATYDNLCVGNEWYRFTSHFLLHNTIQLQYIRSGFNGLLPTYYRTSNNNTVANNIYDLFDMTSRVPHNMNNMNVEEIDRYINIEHCNYIIDTEFDRLNNNYETMLLPIQTSDKCTTVYSFKPIYKQSFLDNQTTKHNRLYRILYMPTLFQTKNTFGKYVLYKRVTVQEQCNE